jgi:serine/threonine protein kinase
MTGPSLIEGLVKNPSEFYERVEADIGEGTYGKVHKSKDIRTGDLVAIKKLKSDTSESGIHFTSLREIKIMRGINHENLMDLRDVYIQHGHVCLVMPYMSTDLRHVIEERKKAGRSLEEKHIKCLAQQVCQGLKALHAKWFVHRDLSPGNVMITATGVAKIGDFGLARPYGSPDKALTSNVVTMWYRSPELFFGARAYSDAVDIWSFGCIVAEMTLLKKNSDEIFG